MSSTGYRLLPCFTEQNQNRALLVYAGPGYFRMQAAVVNGGRKDGNSDRTIMMTSFSVGRSIGILCLCRPAAFVRDRFITIRD